MHANASRDRAGRPTNHGPGVAHDIGTLVAAGLDGISLVAKGVRR
jgi:hypothetical protein